MTPAGEPYPTDNPLIRKLGRFVPLSGAECAALEQLSANSRKHPAGTDLIVEGDKPKAVFLILKGWAYRYKHLADGRRQIMAYLIPGDLCDIQIFLFEKMDHSIGLLSDAVVVKIPAAEILDLMDRFPRIERALLWGTLVDEATLREWLLNVGQRFALQRVAHLFCELCVRLSVVGLVDDAESFSLPLTQAELADTTGMTTVHINRTLQRMRKEQLIAMSHGRLTILDFERLAEISGFTQTYLHTDGPPIEQRLRSRLSPPM
ncbi:MAG: Crp/Fnr family transcriptional regulator [Sphingomonas sp.]|nr:Crp/Fnr family transcriptional regulator [Sphingomonas sp.]